MLWILLFVLIIFWCVGVFYLGYTFYLQIKRKKLYVPFIPADRKGIDAMIDAVNLKGTESVIDIGSGSGSIVFRLAERFPDLRISGIEIHPLLYLFSKIKKKLIFSKADIHLEKADAATHAYGSYDVIFLFMLSTFVDQVLVPKFEKELRPGTRIVSYVFKMSSKQFKEDVIELPFKGWKNKLYVYTKL